MQDTKKTKAQLIDELTKLRQELEICKGLTKTEIGSSDVSETPKHDIAARKEAESVVTKRVIQLETVSRVSTAASTILDTERLLQEVVELTKEQFDLYHVHIYLLNETNETLVLAAGAGEPGQKMVAQGWSIPYDREDSLVAQAARSRIGVIVNDVQNEPNHLPNDLLPNTRAELAVPVIAGTTLLGVLDVQSDKLNYFTDEDIRIQTTLASQVAVALQNSQRYSQNQQALKDVEAQTERLTRLHELSTALNQTVDADEVLNIVATRAKAITGAVRTSVAFTTPDGSHFEIFALGGTQGAIPTGAILPLEGTAVGTAIQEAKIVPTPDTGQSSYLDIQKLNEQQVLSAISVPLIASGEVLGALNAAKNELNGFDRNDENILQQMATLVASNLQIRNLLEEAQNQAHRLALLNDLSTSLNLASSLDDIYRLTVENIPDMISVDRASLLLLDKTASQLVVTAVYGDQETLPIGEEVPLADTPMDRAIQTRQVVHSQGDPWLSVMAVPLLSGGNPIGTLNIGDRRPNRFRGSDESLLLQIAALISASIENRYLFEDTERARRESEEQAYRLAQLNEFSQTLVLADTEDDIFKIAAQQLSYIVEVDRVSVALRPEPGVDYTEVFTLQGEDGVLATGAKIPINRVTGVGGVILDNKILSVSDLEGTEFLDLQQLAKQGLRSIVSAPLEVAGEVIGSLNMGSLRSYTFTPRDEDLIRQITTLLSSAIENRRLLSQTSDALAEASIYRQLVETAGQGIGLSTLEGQIQYINPAFVDLLGLPNAEVSLHQSFMNSYPEPMQAYMMREMLPTLMREGHWVGETKFRTYTGEERDVLESYFLIRDKAGKPLYIADIVTDITSQKALEADLQIRTKAIEASIEPISISDARQPDMPLIYVNPAFERATGYNAEEVIGQNCRFLQGEDRDQPELDTLRKALKEGTACVVTLRNYRKDGTLFINELHISPVYDEQGELTHFLGSQNDVTQRLRAEETLREREAYNNVLFSESSIPQVVLDPNDGQFLDCNKAAVEIYGLANQDDVLGKTLLDVSTLTQYDERPSDEAAVEKITQAMEQGSHIFTWRHQRPTGQIWDAEVNLFTFEYQGETLLQFSLQDITEQRSLAAEVQRLAAIVENHPDFIGVGTLDGAALYVNPAGLQMVGLPKGYDVTQLNADNFYPSEEAQKLIEVGLPTALEQGVWSSETYLLRQDDSPLPVEQTLSINYDQTGQPYSFSITMRDITERQQAADALRKSEERLRSLLASSPDPIVTYDDIGQVTYLNPAFEEKFGWTFKELLGKRIDFVPEENKAETQAILKQLFADGRIFNFETKRLTKTGKIIEVEQSASVYYDEAGNVVGSIIFVRDITDRRRAEQAIRDSEEQYRQLVETMRDGLIILDKTGVMTYVNNSYCNIIGYSVDELQGRKVADLLNEQNRQILQTRLALRQTGDSESYELNMTHKEGHQILTVVSPRPIYDKSGNVVGSFGIIADITERRAAENELRKLLSAVEQSPNITIITNTKGDIEYVNPKFTEVTGYTAEEVVGENPRILKSGDMDPETYQLLWQSISSGSEWQGELRNRKKNGESYWAAASMIPITNTTGNITHYLSVQEDITDRRQAEQEREQLLEEAQAAYRQFIEREWTQFLDEQHQGRIHFELSEAERERSEGAGQLLEQIQNQARLEKKIKMISARHTNGDSSDEAAIVSPIALRGEVLGTISLEDIDPNRKWTQEEIALVETVSEQLGLTIETLRLFGDTQQRATREQVTREITDKMRAAPDMDSIIETGLSELTKALGASRSYVKLTSDKIDEQ